MRIWLSIVFLCFTLILCAKDQLVPRLECRFSLEDSISYLEGSVFDENGEALLFAKVDFMDSNITSKTNRFGQFKLEVPNVEHFTLDIRYDLSGKYYSFLVDINSGIKNCSIKYNGSITKNEKRFPGENLTIIVSEELFNVEPMVDIEGLVAKPIIYLYPEKKTEVELKLNIDGELTHTYPKYNDLWNVTAYPDGTIFDQTGKEYYSLYWEGMLNLNSKIEEGFVVKGSETINFLEESLAKLGLNRREANEFIIYWLPHLENNPYNLIYFATTDYIAKAELEIEPKPETSIRLLMRYKPLNEKIKIKEQKLPTKPIKRRGFTIVEWGGSLIGTRGVE
jgi:uncharacterized protein YdhG (YjbR/CyaY superfamily)